jgi:hypothetical protein
MQPEEGYPAAKKILQQRFGDPLKIARASVKSLTEGPVLKSEPEHLQEFSDQVQSCMWTLKALGKTNEINTQDRMVEIIDRLPYHVKKRWQKIAVKTKKESGDYPAFAVFANFLSDIAEEANDPLFGDHKRKPPATKEPLKKTGGRTTMAVKTSDSQNYKKGEDNNITSRPRPPCMLCGEEHMLRECPSFANKPLEDKRKIIDERGLCFNCLFRGHRSKECKQKRSPCDTCGRRHLTILHDDNQNEPTTPAA